jgi:hypothetical protein
MEGEIKHVQNHVQALRICLLLLTKNASQGNFIYNKNISNNLTTLRLVLISELPPTTTSISIIFSSSIKTRKLKGAGSKIRLAKYSHT